MKYQVSFHTKTWYLHMWKYHCCHGFMINRTFQTKKYLSKLVWYFTGVYIINRTLHGRLEIQNFSSCVEKNISQVSAANEWNIFQHSKRNFISRRGHVISSIYFILYSLFLTLTRVKYLSLTIKRDHGKLFLALNRVTK